MSASYQSEVETDTPFNDCPDIETTINNTAALNIDILLLGETGTGKDTLAQRIHCLSGRRGTSSRSTVRRYRRALPKASSLESTAAPTPGPCNRVQVLSKLRTWARCTWTK